MGLLVLHLVLSPLVFSAATVEVFEYNKVMLLQLVALLLLGLGASRTLWRLVARPGGERPRPLAELRRSVGRDPVAWGVLAFLLSAAISTATAMNVRTAFFGAHESFLGLLTVAAYAVLFFGTRTVVGGSTDARGLFWASAAASAGAATYAVIQLVRLDPISWGRTASYGDFTRIFATMGHPNFLSAFLVTAFPASAYLAVRAWRRRQRAVAALLAAVIVIGWLVTLASVSRGAWGALVLAFAALWFGWWRVRERTGSRTLAAVAVLGLLGAVAGLLLFVPDGRELLRNVEHRIADLTKLGNESRVHIWKAAWQMFLDHPVTGVGLDCFQLAFEGYRTPAYWHVEWNGTPTKAHNELLHIAATQGAIGLAALGLLTVGLALAFRRALRRARRPEDRALLVALAAGLVGFYAQNLFSFTVAGVGTLAITYMALLSRFAAYDGREDGLACEETDGSCTPPAPLLPPTVLGALLATGGLIATVVLASSIPPQPGNATWERNRAIALSSLLGAILLVAWAARRETEADAATAGPPIAGPRPWIRPDRVLPARLAALAPWPLVALGLWYGIVIPVRANMACRDGRSNVSLGRPRAAIADLQRAVALDPGKELYWVQLGTAYYTASFYTTDPAERRTLLEKALWAHRRSVRLVPVNAYDHANVARVLSDLARLRPPGATPAEVYEAFERALALDPHNAYFLGDAAKAALALGDSARARAYAERNRAWFPHYGPSRAQLGAILMREKRWQEAERELEAAASGNWYGDRAAELAALINLASCRIALGKYAAAEVAARRAVEIEPYNAGAWRKLARIRELRAQQLERDGKSEPALAARRQALAAYRRVLRLAPGDKAARQAVERLEATVPR
ncbi:MAG: hypothetical protein D6776_00635 [Planctomycetota bacterium]|nr:MAG: hypothetical protein D6776_00635 [Planctomycetota bacterium]